MYQPSRNQLVRQAEVRRGVDLRLVVGFLVTSVRWLIRHPEGPVPFIVEGFRTAEQQAARYAQGRTTPGPVITMKGPGHSKHETKPARAIDVGFWDEAGRLQQQDGQLTEFYNLWREHTVEFIWGGHWTTPHDAPHFEV